MAEFSITGTTGCLAVTVAEDAAPVMVPLMGSLPRKQFKRMAKELAESEDKDEYLAEFFRAYIGDAVDEMSMIEFAQLANAWNEASEEEMGASLGE